MRGRSSSGCAVFCLFMIFLSAHMWHHVGRRRGCCSYYQGPLWFVQSFRMMPHDYHRRGALLSSSSFSSFVSSTKASESPQQSPPTASSSYQLLNLSTVTLSELEALMLSLKVPKYRGQQIYHYIRNQGITDVQKMILLPKTLRQQLQELCTASSLKLVQEHVSAVDGTIKRVYQLHDDTLIESVLMGPYQDGRYTACISSQVGCAQACVFCATGQQGFTRQLTASEIFEQVATFSALLQSSGPDHAPDNDHGITTTNNRSNIKVTHGRSKRLSNVVFMGMGEVRLLFQSSVYPRVNSIYWTFFSIIHVLNPLSL